MSDVTVEQKIAALKEKMDAVRQAHMNYKMLEGKFNEDLGAFLREEGLGEQFSLIDLLAHFRPVQKIIT